jgi:isopropylmalate/homocitrate/citramalate synthase
MLINGKIAYYFRNLQKAIEFLEERKSQAKSLGYQVSDIIPADEGELVDVVGAVFTKGDKEIIYLIDSLYYLD